MAAYTQSFLICAVFQEPDTYQIVWAAYTDVNGLFHPGLKDIYLQLIPELYKINPGVLFLIQGGGQWLTNWGDGFITDASALLNTGMSDPNPFFQELVKAPYVDQVRN